jgi:GNAT superfamily N-acetyltransferase
MTVSQWESLVEAPRESYTLLTKFIPDTPWTTTTMQALQIRKALVFVDSIKEPRNIVVRVKSNDDPGNHDQAYLFGPASSEPLRGYISSVERATEFIVDADLVPLVQEIHPDAIEREAMCAWFEQPELPHVDPLRYQPRRLRVGDADAVMRIVPNWALRTFESAKDLIVGGACFGVEVGGQLVSVAYIADQSLKFARISVGTLDGHRRKGYAFAAARALAGHCIDEGRLVCCYAPRRNAPAMHLAMKLGFPHRALLRTYKVQPNSDA